MVSYSGDPAATVEDVCSVELCQRLCANHQCCSHFVYEEAEER